MTIALAVVRAVHLGATLGLVGSLGFVLLVLRSAPVRAGPGREVIGRYDARLWRTAGWCVLVGLSSALAWLALYTAAVGGAGLAGALDPEALSQVLVRTVFGQVWLVRVALLVLVGGLLLLRAQERDARDWIALRSECLVLGAVMLAALAWTGHAAAAEVGPRALRLTADAVHLVASGLWLGGLLALAQLLTFLGPSPEADLVRTAAETVRRFSALATAAVGALLLTGAINAWTLAGDVSGLAGTPYGWLLLVKLALLVPLLGLGAMNRWRIRPQLARCVAVGDVGGASRMIRRLRGGVIAEAVLGALVLLVVGGLGVTPPARHVDPWWPFPIRLSWTPIPDGPATPAWLAGGALYAAAGLALVLYTWRRRTPSRWPVAAGATLVTYGILLALFAWPVIDAYPTTYRRPTILYQAVSIARGGELYATHCAVCHGASGRGDGPARWSLPRDPADLTARHARDHTAGDLFWWLSHGIPASGMPGFEDVMDEAERWDVINFVRALAAGENARRLASRIGPPVVAAPDFAFGIGVGPSQALRDHRGRSLVHLVLFTLPESLPRLEAIDRAWTTIGLAGARVIAIPMREARATYRQLGTRVANPAIGVEGSEEIAAAYTMLAQPASLAPSTPPTHVEFLIDRQGWVRARWIPGQEPAWTDLALLLAEIARLDKEAPSGPPPDDHAH